MSITVRHRITARLRLGINGRGRVWAARGALGRWASIQTVVRSSKYRNIGTATVDRRRGTDMKQKFPTDRAEKRRALLQAVDNVRDILAANAEEAEAIRTLPQASVAALRESGLFTLKLPAVLVGPRLIP